MTEARHLVLIGYRGTGKTTLAPAAAARLGLPALDLDRLLVEQSGRPIAQLWAAEGEAGFRRREAALLAEAIAGPRSVIATGGGVVLDPQNRRRIADRSHAVWLRAHLETIAARLAADPASAASRPRLVPDARTLEQEIAQTLAERAPLYAELAQLTLDTDDATPRTLVDQIVAWLARLEIPAP